MYLAQLGSRLAMPPATPEDELELPPEIVMTPPFPPDEEAPPFDDEDDDDEDEEDEEDEVLDPPVFDVVLDPPVLEEMVEMGTHMTPLRVYPPTQAIHCPLNKL